MGRTMLALKFSGGLQLMVRSLCTQGQHVVWLPVALAMPLLPRRLPLQAVTGDTQTIHRNRDAGLVEMEAGTTCRCARLGFGSWPVGLHLLLSLSPLHFAVLVLANCVSLRELHESAVCKLLGYCLCPSQCFWPGVRLVASCS
jgi:hypothetical protein